MKNIVNIIIKAAVIWLAATLFPERVICDSPKTLATAIIVMLIAGFIMGIIVLGIVGLGCAIDNKAVIGLGIVIAILSGIIQLGIATNRVDGFSVAGTGTYIILAIIMSLCSMSEPKKER